MLRIEPKPIQARPSGAAGARMRGLGTGVEFAGLLAERRPIRTASARMASPIEGLLALQTGEEAIAPAVRRRAGKGLDLLDTLEDLRRETLGGREGVATLEALKDQLAALGPATADKGLERVMQALELRVRVELAKRETVREAR